MPHPSTNSPLVLGIDTGGTYTDGILLDYSVRQVLATHKSLTTKRDLTIGIEQVIEGIHIDDPSAVKMVSVSTTLATNAIAEGKGKRVALLLIGYDPELIKSFNLAGRFATPNFYYFQGGHDFFGQEKAELDLTGILAKVDALQDDVDALAVSSYFSPLNPEHERRVQQALAEVCDLPVVLGHQLSTKLGSVERATTAALNASLLAVLKDFIVAVRRALENRQIDAPLMVVRGDGTLMGAEFASQTPVETIHSGPAASAIGGRFLSTLDDALVVDIGGTTTDLALIEGGQVTVSEEGAMVGEYKTAVKAANLLSIALGGDSHITPTKDRSVRVGPERVTPLSYLAYEYPDVAKRLRRFADHGWVDGRPESLEYWFLLREPKDWRSLTPRQKDVIEFLRNGPQPVPAILGQTHLLAAMQINAGDLFVREVLGKAGLTPTDLLHTDGQMSLWSVDTANDALSAFAKIQQREAHEVREQVWDRMRQIILRSIVSFLSDRQFRDPALASPDMGHWFFDTALYSMNPHLHVSLNLAMPIIGIGAPASIFLPNVADVLNTDLILPDHHEVANAVGAVAGSVMVSEELRIYPRLSEASMEVIGYYVQTNEGRDYFDEVDDALDHARRLSQTRALKAALQAGADNPQVIITELPDGLDSYRIRAEAMGNPRLAR